MKKLKLLFAACALMMGASQSLAQVPFLQEKNDFSGATVSSLATFVPDGTTYTLELTGCVAGSVITVPGGSFSYTPTASGTVRFVRNGGDEVYVYEGVAYKGTVSVSVPDAPTFPAGLTSASTENLIKNGGFEDTSAGTYTSGRYKPTHWTPYNNSKGAPDNGVSVRPGSEMTGSYNMLMHNAGYYLTQQLASGVMKNFTPYQISYKYRANDSGQAGSKYKFQVGNAEFNTDYFSSQENNKGTTDVQTFTATFKTPASIVEQPWIQLYRSTYAYGNNKQALDRFDEFILVAANGGGIGITGATSATFLTGTAYAPEGVLAAALVDGPIIVTSRVTNPNFDSNNTGWTSYTNSSSNKVANNKTDYTTNFWENWNGTAKEGRMFQVISNLPQGTYELQIYAFADQLGYMTPFNTAVAVYAQGQEVGTSSSSYVRPNYVNDVNFAYYKTYAYVDENGKLEIGLRQYSPAQFGWLGIDNVTLKYIATDNQEESKMLEVYQAKWEAAQAILSDATYSDVSGKERNDLVIALSGSVSTYDDYKTKAETAHTACQAFMEAKDVYAACLAEYNHYVELSGTATYDSFISNTTTATEVLNAIKTAEYTVVTTTYQYGVTLGEWNTTGATADNKGQHWDGTEISTYKEQDNNNGQGFNANSWEIGFSQDVMLPAGNYVFKVAGRQANSDKVSLSLVVKQGEAELGTVSDFPKGDTGLGINVSGETDFATGEGHSYANNNAGRGWEWRYVKFTLDEDATVNVAVNAKATAIKQWISFCNYTVQTDDATNASLIASLIAYNIALNSAMTARDAAANKYVGGTDRSNLEAAIAADETLDKTDVSAIDAATEALNTARETFLAGVANWNAYVLAKNTTYEKDQPYASDAKYDDIAAAKGGTAPNTASEAAAKAAAIKSAYRKYIESNALAEGVEGAENMTSLIVDPNMDVTYDVTSHTFGAWQVFGQVDGTIDLFSNQSFTDGDGKNDYKYANIYKIDNNAGIKQTINFAPGRYLLTVTARANSTADATFGLFAGSQRTEIKRIGNSGGVFDRGWNDASVEFSVAETSDVEIGVQSGNGKDLWWSATRFRLVKLPNVTIDEDVDFTPVATTNNVTLNRTIKSNTWNTIVLPFAVSNEELKAAFGDDVAVAEYSERADGNNSIVAFNTMETPEISANTPVLLRTSTAGTEYTFNGRTIEVAEEAKVAGTNYDFMGSYAAMTVLPETDYFISANTIYSSNGNSYVKGTRAYLKATGIAVNSRIMRMTIGGQEVTGVQNVEQGIITTGKVFNMQGQEVNNATKGIYIQNGKKIFIK